MYRFVTYIVTQLSFVLLYLSSTEEWFANIVHETRFRSDAPDYHTETHAFSELARYQN